MATLETIVGGVDSGSLAIKKLDRNIKAVNLEIDNIDVTDQLNTAITTHNSNATAHADIRTKISDNLNKITVLNGKDIELDNQIKILSNPLKGKKWTVMGDSITEYNFATTKNYHGYIADWCGCTIQNLGIGGMGYSSIMNIYSQFYLINPDADYITIMAGTNDYGLNAKPMGAFGSLSADEIAGSMLNCLVMLQNNYWNKKLGIISPLPREDNWGEISVANSQGVTLKMVNDMLAKTCRHLSIPYLDLYSGSGLYPYTTACSAGYFSNEMHPNGDGLHPNALGHAVIARKILEFMVSL